MNLGDTFLLRAPTEIRHLHVAIYCHEGTLVLVNVTTKRPPCDDSCIVQSGEHPFLRQESIVAYRHMKVIDPVRSFYVEKQGILKLYDPVSPELLERIQRGARESAFSARKAQELIRRILV